MLEQRRHGEPQKALVAPFQRASDVTAQAIHQIVYVMMQQQVFNTYLDAGARKPNMDGDFVCHEDTVGEEVLREFEAQELLDASLARRAPVAPSASPPIAEMDVGFVQALKQLQALREAGALDESEFDVAKRRLLNPSFGGA